MFRVRRFGLLLLGIQPVIGLLDTVQGFLLQCPVLGADGLGALERHVLHHVGDTRLAAWVVDRSGIYIGIEGHHRRLMALNDNEMQAVRKRKLRHRLLEITQ